MTMFAPARCLRSLNHLCDVLCASVANVLQISNSVVISQLKRYSWWVLGTGTQNRGNRQFFSFLSLLFISHK